MYFKVEHCGQTSDTNARMDAEMWLPNDSHAFLRVPADDLGHDVSVARDFQIRFSRTSSELR